MQDCSCVIVDDDEDIVTIYSDILTNEGIKVLATGKDGKEAIELYKKHKPKFILLDMKMPKFDGKHAIKEIKAFDANAIIIIMTAYTELEPNLEDVFAVMEKPGDVSGVIELLKDIC